jgi:multiple sugar transport system permease protein
MTRAADIFTWALGLLVAAFFLTPVLWLLSLALRTPAEIYLGAARFIPEEPTLANFGQVLTDGAFPRYLWNGLKLSCAGAGLAVLLATPAAWAFSRHPSRRGNRLLLAILALQMVSPLVLMLPLYRWFDRLGLLDTHTAVILVLSALGIPLSTWLIKLGFDAIPRALSDAAAIDGAGPFATFREISLPLALPSIASAFLLSMIAGWGQFLVPFILLSKDSTLPVSVALFNYAGSTSASTTQVLAAAATLAILPALAVFLILQRTITRALTSGSITAQG